MRLSILDHGHRTRARLFLRLASRDAPDIVRTLLYRPEFFARPLLALTVDAMRGESYWTVAEREYLAMSTATTHESDFCAVTHAEMIKLAGDGGELTPRPELVAVRAFLEALQQNPGAATPPADLPEAAVRDALRVVLVWEVVNRLSNAFGFELRGDQLHSGTRALHKFGYRFPGFLLAGGTDQGDDSVANLRHAVFAAPAVTDSALRTAAGTSTDVSAAWTSYVDLVRTASHRITPADIDALVAAHGEGAVFEMTVAAAVGAALQLYDAGQQVLAHHELH